MPQVAYDSTLSNREEIDKMRDTPMVYIRSSILGPVLLLINVNDPASVLQKILSMLLAKDTNTLAEKIME